MLSVEKAREIILSKVPELPSERVSLENALGRYLAQDIISSLAIPPCDNSAMDGYALRTDDVKAIGITLKISSILPADAGPGHLVAKGQAAKIMTGAPIPQGADAVVRREDTKEEERTVTINKVPKKNENIRFKGEDIAPGQLILTRGTLLGPAVIGMLASLRRPMVQVSQRPLVAVLATGDEIVELGEDAPNNAIISSNSYTLLSLIRITGGIPCYLGIARDRKEDLKARLACAKKADLIITSGGVSMGDYDMIREVMNEDGNSLVFWGIEMKPGKPLAFGSFCGVPAIGLPGNPVSTMTSFYQFARPAILKMQGAKDLLLPRVRARLKEALKNSGDRPHYIRGILERSGDDLVVSQTGPQGSGILSSMAKGNCYIVLPKGTTSLPPNSFVECEVFHIGCFL